MRLKSAADAWANISMMENDRVPEDRQKLENLANEMRELLGELNLSPDEIKNFSSNLNSFIEREQSEKNQE